MFVWVCANVRLVGTIGSNSICHNSGEREGTHEDVRSAPDVERCVLTAETVRAGPEGEQHRSCMANHGESGAGHSRQSEFSEDSGKRTLDLLSFRCFTHKIFVLRLCI